MTDSMVVADGLRSPDSLPLSKPRQNSVDLLADDFDSFVRARTPALLRAAYLLTGDQHLAEDLVQSALARAHRRWSGLSEQGNGEAYTRKIMYRAFTAGGRVVLIADHNRGNGGAVDPFLTIFGPDGAVLAHGDLPSMEYGYLLAIEG
jgi:hypothetical protein